MNKMTRKEAYNNIKICGFASELQKKFGKPYSSVSNAELIPAVEELLFGKTKEPKVADNKNVENSVKEESKPKKLSTDERIKLGREYVNQITSLKARKEYMENSLELITTRDDLTIRISRGGSVMYYIKSDESIKKTYSNYEYPDYVTSMYYYVKNVSYGKTREDVPLSTYVSNEDNVKLIQDEYISLYKESISDIDNLIKELEIKFAEL